MPTMRALVCGVPRPPRRRAGIVTFGLDAACRRQRALRCASRRRRARARDARRARAHRAARAGPSHGEQRAGGRGGRACGASAGHGDRARPRGLPAGARAPRHRDDVGRRRGHRRQRTTRIRTRCAPRSTCSRRVRVRAGSCSATWARSARQVPAFHREIGDVRARRRASSGCSPSATLARDAVRAFGAGAEHFESVDDARATRRRRCARGRHRARQGIAVHADGARRRGADGRRIAEVPTDAALALRAAVARRPCVQRLQLHHAARGARDDDGAHHLVPRSARG